MSKFHKLIIGLLTLIISLSIFANNFICPSYYRGNSYPLLYVTVFDPEHSSSFEAEEYIASLVPDETSAQNSTLKLRWKLDRKNDRSVSVQCFYQGIKTPLTEALPKNLITCIFSGQDKPLSEKITEPGHFNCF